MLQTKTPSEEISETRLFDEKFMPGTKSMFVQPVVSM